MKTVIVTLDEHGNATVATSGFAGAECLHATRQLEKALGFTTNDKKTSEYQKPVRVGARVNRQQGT